MEENKEEVINKKYESKKVEEWKEFDEFYNAHSLQLFGLNFPKELCEKLYYKLKYEIYDSGRFFEVLEDPEEEVSHVKAKISLKAKMEVFLIDHFWTFKLRQINSFFDETKYPNLISRVSNMLKYTSKRKPIFSQEGSKEPATKKNLIEYLEILKESNNYVDLDYDEYDLEDKVLDDIVIDNTTELLSLQYNNIQNFGEITTILDRYPGIKALWVEGNPFEDEFENYQNILAEKYIKLEIINRKLTSNASSWSIQYLKSRIKKDENFFRNDGFYLDLSGRDPLTPNNLNIYVDLNNVDVIDLRDNSENILSNLDNSKFFNFLLIFPKLNRIFVDEEIEMQVANYLSCFTEKFVKNSPKFKYVNHIMIDNMFDVSPQKIESLHSQYKIIKNIAKISNTYRLMTENKYDEESIWYVMDELGTYINHSDKPNMIVVPFIYSKSNTFKDDMITYSIMWPISDIYSGSEITRDFLLNINEQMQRSARLTVWFQTPREYFLRKFQDNSKVIEKLTKNSCTYFQNYNQNLDKLILRINNCPEEKTNEIYNEIDKLFDFKLLDAKIKQDNLNTNIKDRVRQNIINSIKFTSAEKSLANSDKVFKVFSDLPYVRENLKLKNFEVTMNLEEADILWLNFDYFTLKANNKIYYHDFVYSDTEKPSISLKPIHFKNQFPFENIVTHKTHLMNLLQDNLGVTKFYNISYNMDTQLSEIIGHFFYNEEKAIDNSWILKPVNMTRSMDMIVTDNIDQIIRNVETGPKICQKYLNKPLLFKNKKFDLRFIILLKKLVPLELYIYERVFWVRVANKEFNLDSLNLNDYERHFTVMNYNKDVKMQQIFNTDFLDYLKQNNIDWNVIYDKIKQAVKDTFITAAITCPQMTDYYARAIYGLDIMIDENLQPYVLEFNFSPDCTRACKYTPQFFDDIFSTFFLNHESGVSKI